MALVSMYTIQLLYVNGQVTIMVVMIIIMTIKKHYEIDTSMPSQMTFPTPCSLAHSAFPPTVTRKFGFTLF